MPSFAKNLSLLKILFFCDFVIFFWEFFKNTLNCRRDQREAAIASYGSKLFFKNILRMTKLADRAKIPQIQKQFEGVTDLPDGRVTSSPRETKIFRGLDDDFGLKRPKP
jgi:hypothetical protein